jgi:hypothetical protein
LGLEGSEREPLWAPQPENKPQQQAYESEADELFCGGAAGPGKTELLMGTAITQHRNSIIFRREYTQFTQIEDRLVEMLGEESYNRTKHLFRWEGKRLELGAVKDRKALGKFQGRPHDYIGFDELAEFPEFFYLYLTTWLRADAPGQKTRIRAAGNPPMSPEGRWIVRRWAAWLDPNHPDPAEPGELRWYVRLDSGDEVEVDGPDPIEDGGKVLRPKSRTFIPGRVTDNPVYAGTQYEATLDALQPDVRAVMRDGDFSVSLADDPMQVFPGGMIQRAMDRWEPPEDEPIDMLGVDVARGGRDQTVFAPRHGRVVGELHCVPGRDTPNGPTLVAAIRNYLGQATPLINLDLIGVGSSPYDDLTELGYAVTGIDGAAGAKDPKGKPLYDRTGLFRFRNLRAAIFWHLRELMESEEIDLPPDPRLRAAMASLRWKPTPGGILVQDKDDLKSILGFSPDELDGVGYACWEPAGIVYSLKTRAARRQTGSANRRFRTSRRDSFRAGRQ